MRSFRPFPKIRGGFVGIDRTALEAEAVDVADFLQVHQVHGNQIAFLASRDQISQVKGSPADALLTTVPGIPVAVRTADCVPILLAHPKGLVAAIHAGWKGSALRILPETLHFIESNLGWSLDGLKLSIGPAICQDCYEVGPEVAAHFEACTTNPVLRPGPGGKLHLDLKAVNYWQAVDAGVSPAQIEVSRECTRCQPSTYYSFRYASSQNRPTEGRNYSWVLFSPE